MICRSDAVTRPGRTRSAHVDVVPVRAGDVLEVTARVVRVGRRSREIDFAATVVCRGRPDRGGSAAEVLDPPLLATTARGTVVVPGPTA